jgi:hypothetical protein
MNPGQVAELATSNGLVLRAQFPSSFHVEPADLYWRGGVLSTSNGLAWKDPQMVLQVDSSHFVPKESVLNYEIIIEPINGNFIFTLEQTFHLKSIEGSVQSFEHSLWRSSSATTKARRYIATMAADFSDKEPPEKRDLQHLPLPPETNRWVHTVRAQFSESADRLEALKTLFMHPSFVYTLQPGPYPDNGLDEFLFQRRRGFCEHFAGAYATLARALGIPARVVSGYQGGQYNTLGGFWRVTQKNAHAWVEIWNGKEWARQDPTTWVSQSEFSRNQEKSFFEWMDEAYDSYEALNYRWTTFLLDFDQNSQGLAMREWLPKISIVLLLIFALYFLIRLTRTWLSMTGTGVQKLRQNQLSLLLKQIKESEEEYLNQDLSSIPPLEILKSAKKHLKGHDTFFDSLSDLYDRAFYQGEIDEEALRKTLPHLQKKWVDIQILHK